MDNHILKKYDQELDKLRLRLIKMGNLVQQQLELAITSMKNGDIVLVGSISKIEDKINQMDVKIDKQCAKIIALHQPVARDLQLILAGFQINSYFEVIGDMVKEITKDIVGIAQSQEVFNQTKIEEIGLMVRNIFHQIIQSLSDLDVDCALEAIKLQNQARDLFKSNFDLISTLMVNNNQFIQAGVYLLDVNRVFQIIAAQTKTIAQALIYMFESENVKHIDINSIEKKISDE